MATSNNENGNLVDEFEQAFQKCVGLLTKNFEGECVEAAEETKNDVENATSRFLDLGRQMESFFLQKRFLLSALKPELIIKEDIAELKAELKLKDQLIQKCYEKTNVWQKMLSDIQFLAQAESIENPVQNQMSFTQSPILQQQQQPQIPRQRMQLGAQGSSSNFGPQRNLTMNHGTFPQFVGNNTAPQGPLAFLEKTTSNIGMTDSRS